MTWRVRFLLAVLVALEVAWLCFASSAQDHAAAVEAALAAGKRPDWWDDAVLGMRYAAGINAGLLSLLLLTSGWWTRSLTPTSEIAAPLIQTPRWFWPLVLLAVLTGLGMRLPLASKSLWWDEAWVVQQVSHGKWRPDSKQPDKLKFLAHDWRRCAFYYQKPTNHVPMSLAQKASLTVWQKITGAKRETFNDLAARAPALLASCGAVLLLALLLRAWGQPGAGVAAAFVIAVHPWAMRYGVDARGYALVMPLCVAGLLCLTRLLQSHGTKLWPWLCWGAVEFLWLWACPNGAVDVAALNLVALAFLIARQPSLRDRWTVAARLGATNVLAATCFLQVFLPNLMQARRWAGQVADAHVLDWPLLNQTAANLLVGLEHSPPIGGVEAAGIPYLAAQWIAASALVCVIALSAVNAGITVCRRAPSPQGWLLGALLVSTAAFMGITRLPHGFFYPRFIIAVLPVVIIVSVLALLHGPRRASQWVVGTCGALLFLWLAWPAWGLLLTRPIAPLHDAATFVERASETLDKAPFVACYGLGREVMPVYAPTCQGVESATELQGVIDQAKAQQRALFVIQGYNNFNRQLLPDGFKLLDDRTLFTEVAAFPGIDSEFYFRVFRLQ
ncbi:MAG: hypothetical protein ACOYMN_08700 [Roseimicrobium sp.]